MNLLNIDMILICFPWFSEISIFIHLYDTKAQNQAIKYVLRKLYQKKKRFRNCHASKISSMQLSLTT